MRAAGWLVVLALAVASAPLASAAQSNRLPAVQVSPLSKLVTLQQVVWSLDSGRVADSDWGQVQVNTKQLAALSTLVGTKGYVNVFLPDPNRFGGVQWVVNNLYVTTDPGSGEASSPVSQALLSALAATGRLLPATAMFDLRPGVDGDGRLQRIQAIVLLSSQALPNITRVQELAAQYPPQWFTIEQVIVNAEGHLGEPLATINTPPPFNIDLLVGQPPQAIIVPPQPPEDFGFPKVITQASLPNIPAAKNQCVPMAFANAYGYLEARYNDLPLVWDVPHAPVPGIGKTVITGDVTGWEPDPEISLIAQVDYRTRRQGVFNFEVGEGSDGCQLIQGAFSYLANNASAAVVKFRHVGGAELYGDEAADADAICDGGPFPLGGYLSAREAAHPTWQWIFDQLQAGRAVAIVYGYYDINGNRTGGHMLRVWGAGQFNGRNFVYTVDDGNQGLPSNGGLRTTSWEVADTGQPGLAGIPDGQLNMGGTNWELEFAMSIEAKPTLNIP